MRDRICLGNLKEMSLDEILINEKRDKIYENEIVNCGGCTNPCEVNREINLFQQGLHLYENEIADVMRLEETEKIGDAVLDYEDWHAIEHYGENRTLCWSRNSIARVFLPVLENAVIRVQYRKLISGQRIKIFVNGKEVLYDNEDLTNSFYIEPMETGKSYYTIQFISQMLCPMELNINEDRRYLGIGLEDVRWCDRRC